MGVIVGDNGCRSVDFRLRPLPPNRVNASEAAMRMLPRLLGVVLDAE